MSDIRQYVGLRQWAALSAAELALPQRARWGALVDAVKNATEHRNASGVVESLLECGMLAHGCWDLTHRETIGCEFNITERGRDAHLNASGRRRLVSRL